MKHWLLKPFPIIGGMIASFFLCIVIYWFTPLGILPSASVVIGVLILISAIKFRVRTR